MADAAAWDRARARQRRNSARPGYSASAPSASPPQALGVRHEEVVADELDAVTDPLGQKAPAVPVLLPHPVLDRHDWVAVGNICPVVGQLGSRQRSLLVLELVTAVPDEL